MPRLGVLFVVSECVPFAKTGGLGDVAGALPIALALRGHDVRVVLPRYRATKRLQAERHAPPLAVPMDGSVHWAAVWEAALAVGVRVYMVEHEVLYDREGIYGDEHGEFGDNALRFAFLSRAALALCGYLPFAPDVVHVHDWQSALVPVYLRRQGGPATIVSIHNLGYQGRYGIGELGAIGLGKGEAAGLGLEHQGGLNLLRGGLCCATMLATVSPRYAAEIQTAEGGVGLDGVLRDRSSDLVGILNGIDDTVWDPSTDGHLPARYSVGDLSGKATCKAALQRELGLAVRAEVPLIGMVARLTWQKGIDAFAGALERLLPLDVQFAVLGAGEAWAEALLARLDASTANFRARVGYDDGLAHRIEAGSDLFCMPSRYEPCGLNQMYSQRYGTLPVVRGVGGLLDSVEHEETGFVFAELDAETLALALAHGADTYRYRREHFVAMQRMAMSKRMGWDRAAAQYEALYRLAIARHASQLTAES